MSVPQDEPHAAAVLAALQAGVPASFTMCDGDAPADPVNSVPYLVVYADPGTLSGGPFRPNAELGMLVSVRAVGVTPEQARRGQDAARAVMLGDPIVVAGRVVTVSQGETSADKDDSLSVPLFWSLVVYRLRST